MDVNAFILNLLLFVVGYIKDVGTEEHIGKNFKFLAADEGEEQADDWLVGGGGGGEEFAWDLPNFDGDDNSSIPLAMRLLLYKEKENEIRPREKARKKTSSEDFTPIAKSLTPDSVEIGTHTNVAVVNFTVPNEYSRALGTDRTTWLILTLNNSKQHIPFAVRLFDNHEISGNGLINSTQVDSFRNFILFNVTKHVKYSFRNQSLSFSLAVQNSGHFPTKTPVVTDFVELYGFEKGPILVSTSRSELSAFDMSGALRRKKRRTRRAENSGYSSERPTTVTSTETPVTSSCDCRLQEWAPSKDELGWSWLIRPENVPINFCIGSCPVPLLNSTYNASSNAIARDYYRTIIKARDPNLNHPPIHCVPIQYRPVAVLIESAPGIISMERVSTLAVSQCGCR